MQDRIGQTVTIGDVVLVAHGDVLERRTVTEVDEDIRIVRAVRIGDTTGRVLRAEEFLVMSKAPRQQERVA
jgi:hypothetical protein